MLLIGLVVVRSSECCGSWPCAAPSVPVLLIGALLGSNDGKALGALEQLWGVWKSSSMSGFPALEVAQ